MSDVEKASREAVEAARQGEQFALILAAVQAAQQRPECHHPAPAPQSSGQAAKWIGIGVGASIFLMAVAVSAVAVAISAVALTICVLVLRGIWQDVQKKGGK